MAGIHATVPVLASLDLAESRQFYTELLGFECLHASANYLMLRRDGCELHLWHCTALPTHPAVNFLIDITLLL